MPPPTRPNIAMHEPPRPNDATHSMSSISPSLSSPKKGLRVRAEGDTTVDGSATSGGEGSRRGAARGQGRGSHARGSHRRARNGSRGELSWGRAARAMPAHFMTMRRPYRDRRAMPVREKPMTPPARNAVLKECVQPTVCEQAPTVHRAFEKTATRMPMKPEIMDVTAPTTNDAAERAPIESHMAGKTSVTKMAQSLYSAFRNELAPRLRIVAHQKNGGQRERETRAGRATKESRGVSGCCREVLGAAVLSVTPDGVVQLRELCVLHPGFLGRAGASNRRHIELHRGHLGKEPDGEHDADDAGDEDEASGLHRRLLFNTTVHAFGEDRRRGFHGRHSLPRPSVANA